MYKYTIFIFYLSAIKTEYRLYESDSISYYQCLYHRVLNVATPFSEEYKDVKHPYELIPYCIRSLTNNTRNENGSIFSSLTFEQLKRRQIQAHDLLSWCAPIDLVERYENYLNNSLENETFHNCTPSWFDPFCQYTFNSDQSFSDIVLETFFNKDNDVETIFRYTNLTCYEHVECNRAASPLCLDWREICDRRIDCLNDGIDEMNCIELELNECEKGEYRCQNGMCVYEKFLRDDWFNPDCLDSSDESGRRLFADDRVYFEHCAYDPALRCEETRFAYLIRNFVCGDGEEMYFNVNPDIIEPEMILNEGYPCVNGRRDILFNSMTMQLKDSNYSSEWALLLTCAIMWMEEKCYAFFGNQRSISIEERCSYTNYIHPSTSALRSLVRSYNILIVGGGVAGPALAFFLHRYSMKPVVVERAPQLRASGQTVDLRAEGKEIVRRMGIESKVREKIPQEQGVMIVDTAGQSRATFDVKDSNGQGFTKEIKILREEFAYVLYEHIRNDVEYIFSDQPEAIHDRGDRVQVTFTSSNTRDFDLVVGADGIRSKTRRLVFDEKSPISYADLYTAYFSIPHRESDGNWARWYNAPEGRAIILRPDNQGKTRVLLNFRSKERGYENLDVAAQKHLLQKLFADAGFDTPRILNELPNTNDFYLDSIGQVKMSHWTQGRVALVGDAGSCPSSITDMGTTLAFISAYILAGELARNQDYTEAFKRYETLMRPYVTKAQKMRVRFNRIKCSKQYSRPVSILA